MPSDRNKTTLITRIVRAPGQLGEWLAEVLKRFGSWLAEWGHWLVSPIEWLFAAIGKLVFKTAEGFEGAESVVLRIGMVLTWPLRAIWRLLAGLARMLLPESLRRVLMAPIHGIANVSAAIGHFFVNAAEKLNLDVPILWLVRMLRPLWYPFAAIGGFAFAWLSTRNWRQLLWGVPALVILLPLAVIVGHSLLFGRGSTAGQYSVAMQKAIEEKDYTKISMFERKLAQLGVDTKRTDFNAAVALGEDGKVAEAYERMQVLAPTDEPGYPMAHLWIIQRILDGKLNLSRDESLRLLKIHLDLLDKIGIKIPEIQMMRAYWMTQTNQPAEAARLLEPLVNKIPQAAVMRMEIDTSRQMMSEAKRDARAVRVHMADRAGKNQALTSADYRAWTFAERLVGDDSKLQSILRQWIKIDPDNREARQVYADLCRKRFIELLGSPHADDEEILDLFLTEAEYSNNRLVLQDDATVLCRLQSDLPVAKRVIDQLLTSPRTTSPVLEILGTVAALEGRWDQAEVILKRSRDLDPNNPVAWNNLACVYSQRPKPDLQQALIAANKALELAPDEYRFRETRGQIMVKLKRWQEAVDDLEFAVNGIPDAPQVHSSLAAAYEALGQPQLARAHRKYAP